MPAVIASSTSVSDLRAIERAITVAERLDGAERQLGADRPDGALQLFDEGRRPDALAAHEVEHRAARVLCDALGLRQVHGFRRGLVDAVVVNVADDADDRRLGRRRRCGRALAERRGRGAPPRGRDVLRHDCTWAVLVGVGPFEVAAGEQRRAERREEARRRIAELGLGGLGRVVEHERAARAVAEQRPPRSRTRPIRRRAPPRFGRRCRSACARRAETRGTLAAASDAQRLHVRGSARRHRLRAAREAADHEARADQAARARAPLARRRACCARGGVSRPALYERAAPRSASTTRGAACFAIGIKRTAARRTSSETPSVNSAHVRVDADIERARQRAAGEPQQRGQRGAREQQPCRAADQREQRRSRAASCARSRPQAAPSAARIASSWRRALRAHEQQIRDVRAGDQAAACRSCP